MVITFCFILGAPNAVPDVTVVNDSITLDGNNVSLTLSWGEPFNNFDPIVNYTVRCLGDVTCPPDFNTTDNTTRNYTITGLVSGTHYTFLVGAFNSINQSVPVTLVISAPSGIWLIVDGAVCIMSGYAITKK